MNISIIIPTYREQERIGKLIEYLKNNPAFDALCEIIVVDSQSPDDTVFSARKAGAKVYVIKDKKRSAALHYGSLKASGRVLYFLHADTFPAANFLKDILLAVDAGYYAGSLKLRFDHKHWFLQLACFLINLNFNIFRFGDQSLFITKKLYRQIHGYNTALYIMEDFDIVRRVKSYTNFKVINSYAETSARKFLKIGIFRLFNIYVFITILYFLGFSQKTLFKFYKSLITASNRYKNLPN